jgi:hypothetical protein
MSLTLLEDYGALTKACGLERFDCQIVPYHPALLAMMTLRPADGVFFKHIPNFSKVIDAYADLGPVLAGCHKGKPIVIVGCVPLWKGTAELIMLTDAAITSVVRPFYTATLRLLDIFVEELNIVRLQCTVHSQNDPGLRFMEALKFQREGRLKCYGPDQHDFFIFSRVKNGRII